MLPDFILSPGRNEAWKSVHELSMEVDTIGSLFTELVSVDGGNGTDTCKGSAAWAKVSC